MNRKTTLLGTSLLVLLATGACQDAVTSPAALAPASSSRDAVVSPETTLTRPDLGLLAGASDLRFIDPAKVINPGDYVCSDASPVNDWINGKIDESIAVEPSRFFTAYGYLAADIPVYEAIYFQSTATRQYFGVNGEHTQRIGKTEKDLKRFWAIPSADMQVVAMHGNVLVDTIRTYNTYRLFGYPAAYARVYAQILRNAIVGSQTMVNGNHPFFTFNAVSVGAFGSIPNKIVMGDGIMQVYDAIGFGDIAPQAILAHEFAHQVQFAGNYGIGGTAPEQTRFAELGADFMAAYFLTHSRGASLNQKRVAEFLQVFYDIGDCSFTDPSHHGTPNQRMAAARAGFALADQAQKQGHILSPDEAQAAFLAVYPTLIAPDAH